MSSRWSRGVALVWVLTVSPPVLAQAPTGAPASTTPAASTTAQEPAATPPATRLEQIELARRQKHATLWPEHESPLVVKANRLETRGFVEGIQSGEGNSGWQLLLTGTRPAQGLSGPKDWRTRRMTKIYDLSDPANPKSRMNTGLAGSLRS